MRHTWLSWLLASVLLLTACGQGQVASSRIPTIKIGYLPITHAAPLYFEKEYAEEFFPTAKIELVKFGSWIDLMDALNTGRIDGASVLIELAMKAKEKGIDLKAVALGHRDGNALIASPDINSVQDLKGTTVAIPHSLSSQNILLYDMLLAEGMAYEDVNIVEMAPPEMPAALSEKRISSYIVAEPFGALGVTLGAGNVLKQSNDIWQNSLCCALVMRSDFLEEHKELATSFIQGYARAGTYIEETHDSHHTHKEYLNVDDETLALSLEWISYDGLEIREEDYDYLRDRLLVMGLSEDPPTYEEFVDPSYLNEMKGEEAQ